MSKLELKIRKTPPTLRQLEEMHLEAAWQVAPEHLQMALQAKANVQWLHALQNGKPVGMVRLQYHQGDFCYVSEMMVKKKWRGKGIGGFLLKEAEKLCDKDKISLICLQPTDVSIDFYRHYGYQWSPTQPPTLFKKLR